MPYPDRTTAADASKGAAAVVRALREAIGADVGLESFAAAPETGIALVVQPGHARIEHSQPGALPNGTEALQVNLGVTLAIVSSGVTSAGDADPFLDEAVEASVALALACRDPRTIEVSGTTAVLHSLQPEGRPGIRQVADQPDSFECRWSGVLSFAVTASPLVVPTPDDPLNGGTDGSPTGDAVEAYL